MRRRPPSLGHPFAESHPRQFFLQRFAFCRIFRFGQPSGERKESLLLLFFRFHATLDEFNHDAVGGGSL